MIGTETNDYGDLFPLVKAAGWAVSAAWAIIFGWRGRSKKWAPIEEDIPGGPARVTGLFTAVGLAVLWFEASQFSQSSWIVRVGGVSVVLTLLFFLLNNFGITTLIYEKETAPTGVLKREKIVGGLWLTPQAREVRKKKRQTIQAIFKGMAFDEDSVWPRPARALSKQCFVICYVVFTVAGSVALACGALALLASRQPRILQFSISPTEIKRGDPSKVKWAVVNATATTLTPGGPVPERGEQTIRPEMDENYTLTAKNMFGTKGVLQGVTVLSASTPNQVKRTTSNVKRPAPPATTGSFLVEARDCRLVKNVVIRGDGWLQTEAERDDVSTAECDIPFAATGKYELFVKYASDESRAVRITLNNYILQEKALSATTGGWGDPNTVDQTLGTVQVRAGNNTIQFHSDHAFPHIQQIRFQAIQ